MHGLSVAQSLHDFTSGLDLSSLPFYVCRFINQALFALLVSGRCLVAEWARVLAGPGDILDSHRRRLSRGLGSCDLSGLCEKQRHEFAHDLDGTWIVAIDPGDITKTKAEKMEALGPVADGSKDHASSLGYWLLSAVAVKPCSQDKTPRPLFLSIHSTLERSFTSENTCILDLAREIRSCLDNPTDPPVLVMDRGGDRCRILAGFAKAKFDFIVRISKRNFKDAETGEPIVIPSADFDSRHLEFTTSLERSHREGERSVLRIRFDFVAARASDSLARAGFESRLWIVSFWNSKHKNPVHLVTTKPVHSQEDAIGIIISYLCRWSVEEMYRVEKQIPRLEEVRTGRYIATKNIVNLVFLAMCFLYSFTKWPGFQRMKNAADLFLRRCEDDLFNPLYRAARIIARALGNLVVLFHATRARSLHGPPLRFCLLA